MKCAARGPVSGLWGLWAQTLYVVFCQSRFFSVFTTRGRSFDGVSGAMTGRYSTLPVDAALALQCRAVVWEGAWWIKSRGTS
ncbi:hypothetical protein STUTZSP0542_03690 [Stutzerimonas marianensis]